MRWEHLWLSPPTRLGRPPPEHAALTLFDPGSATTARRRSEYRSFGLFRSQRGLTMRSEWRASRFQGGVSPCECRAIHTGSVVDWRAARREAATTRLNVGYSSAIWSYLTGSTPGGRTIRKMVSDLQLLEYVLALRFVVKFSELALVSLALSPCSISVRNLRRTAATKYSESASAQPKSRAACL